MTHLSDDRIIEVALGDPLSAQEQGHLDGCPPCTDALAAAIDTISATRSSEQVELVDPPSHVWESIAGQICSDSLSTPSAPTGTRAPLTSRAWQLAAACLVGLVLGLGAALGAMQLTDDDPAEQARTVGTASLTPLDSDVEHGTARVVDDTPSLVLDLPAMDLDPGSGYLEVWLINEDLTRMISIGIYPDAEQGITLPISQQLLDEGYRIVDVSREPFDDNPAHSGDTLVRGEISPARG